MYINHYVVLFIRTNELHNIVYEILKFVQLAPIENITVETHLPNVCPRLFLTLVCNDRSRLSVERNGDVQIVSVIFTFFGLLNRP